MIKYDLKNRVAIVTGGAQGFGLAITERFIEAGAKVFKKCAACHSIDKGGVNKIGPALWGVVNRKIGGVEGFKYSTAMAQYGKNWSFEELNGFLHKPMKYMKGTKMGFVGLKKDKDRANVIAYMNSKSDAPAPLK